MRQAGIRTALSLNDERNVNSKMADHQCPTLVNAKHMLELKDSVSTSNTNAIFVPSVVVASTQIKEPSQTFPISSPRVSNW